MKNERFYLIELFFYLIDKLVYGFNRDKKRKVKKMKFFFFVGWFYFDLCVGDVYKWDRERLIRGYWVD